MAAAVCSGRAAPSAAAAKQRQRTHTPTGSGTENFIMAATGVRSFVLPIVSDFAGATRAGCRLGDWVPGSAG